MPTSNGNHPPAPPAAQPRQTERLISRRLEYDDLLVSALDDCRKAIARNEDPNDEIEALRSLVEPYADLDAEWRSEWEERPVDGYWTYRGDPFLGEPEENGLTRDECEEVYTPSRAQSAHSLRLIVRLLAKHGKIYARRTISWAEIPGGA